MTFIITLIYFILILGITVTIHEFGHFLFAKKAGVYVYEFSIGMGPQLLKWHRKNDETTYSLRALPIGGYVQMAGESVEEDKNIPKEKMMQSKTWLQRFLIIIAGIAFNFLLAITLLFIIALVQGAPQSNTYIGAIDENLPAYQSGMKVGDEILAINDKKINSSDMFLLRMQVYQGKEITLSIKHEDGSKDNIKIKPVEEEIDGEKVYKYGFGLQSKVEKGFLPALKYAFTKTGNLIEQMVFVIGYLITGKIGLNSLAGPIGIFNVVGESAKAGFINIIYLLAFISINVGFINLLPIPAFDGGRLLFLVIEKIKGKPVDAKVENIIHSIGFILLMLLMIVITWNDIARIFIGKG